MQGPPAKDGKLGPGGVFRPPLLEKSNTFPPDCAVELLAGFACMSTSVLAPTDVPEAGSACATNAKQDSAKQKPKISSAVILLNLVRIA
jgi:hypothetical protein